MTTYTNQVAFDHQSFASSLGKLVGKNIDGNDLPITNVDMTGEPLVVTFSAYESQWEYDIAQDACHQKIDQHPDQWRLSPDGSKAAFVREYNLWLRDLESGEETALTTDGEEFHCYGSAPTVIGMSVPPICDFSWSPDSKYLASTLIDTRDLALAMPLVQHVPDEGLRPKIIEPERRYAIQGDENIEAWQVLTIDVETGALNKAGHRAIPMNYPCYDGFFQGNRGWWNQDSQSVYFIDQNSDRTQTKLMKWDVEADKVTLHFEEDPKLEAILFPKTYKVPMLMVLPETNELIWYSERSGWAHLYLYDLTTGQLKNAITKGEWLVRSILHFDTERRELFIQTACRTEGHHAYYQDVCRVNIDTGHLTTVVTSNREYIACEGKISASYKDRRARSVSPSGQYLVVTRSQVDEVPISLLYDRDGQELMKLEEADLSAMPEGWQWPEAVTTRSADGKADVYGVIFRPPNFSPEKIYPIIDYSFLLYVEPTGAFTGQYFDPLAYAELGFIVVKFFNRGILGLRDRAFREERDYTLPLLNMTDNVAGIKQLAERYPYMDINRVGCTIHSSMATGVTGVLTHPDFYKVGVCLNSGSDGRLVWSGDEVNGEGFPQLEEFAGNLRGKLFLIAGMLDPVLPVTGTFRLVEALHKANKTFDMLVLPNFGHEMSGYVTRRTWDYFVEHLLGESPPENFTLRYMLGE